LKSERKKKSIGIKSLRKKEKEESWNRRKIKQEEFPSKKKQEELENKKNKRKIEIAKEKKQEEFQRKKEN